MLERKINLIILLLLAAFLISTPLKSNAGEPLFAYLYTTDLLPAGHFETEQWITDREGQANGFFHHFDTRTELEYGVSDIFQIAGYVNYMYADESGNSVRSLTEGLEIPSTHDSANRYNTARFDGISLEAMYRVLSPYIDPIGLAFYIEPEFGIFSSGIEIRSIIQKNFLDDQLVLASNIWIEFDREDSSNLVAPGSTDVPDGAKHNATYLEADLGISYRIAPKWFAGLEFRNHNEYDGFSLSARAQAHSAFFLGPNIHYAAEKWFLTFAALRQLGAVTMTEEQRAQTSHGLLYGDEHTNWDGLRLIVGTAF